MNFANTGKDPERSRAEAARQGRLDGQRGYPSPSSDGTPVEDYYADAQTAEAKTAADIAIAGRMNNSRPQDDQAVAEYAYDTRAKTTATADTRCGLDEARHSQKALARLPLAARLRAWPAPVRWGLIGLMALGTGAALGAGLLSITSDAWYFAVAYGGGISIGVVVLGVFMAHLVRSYEFNRRKAHEFTAGRLAAVVLVVALILSVGLAVALGEVRGTANKADAQRTAAANSPVQTFVPGQAPTAGANNATKVLPAHSVPPWTWGLFEALLLGAAFGVEYIGFNPWSEETTLRKHDVEEAKSDYQRSVTKLAQAAGQLKGTADGRADRDIAVLIAAEATKCFADTEVAEYRRHNLSNRSSGSTADPFVDRRQPTDGEPVEALVKDEAALTEPSTATEIARQRWGLSLRPTDTGDEQPLDRFVADTLARAAAELDRAPKRPGYHPVTWDPAALVNAELGDEPPHQTLPDSTDDLGTDDEDDGNVAGGEVTPIRPQPRPGSDDAAAAIDLPLVPSEGPAL